jgi:prephenate dehydrogenase
LLRQQIDELEQLRDMIEQGHWDAMREVFERARDARERHLNRID